MYPAQEWLLLKNANGRIFASHMDYLNGGVQEFVATEFERGDAIRFAPAKNVSPGYEVSMGDTIGHIFSNETRRQLTALRGELSVMQASLRVLESGDKVSVVTEATERVNYAKKQIVEEQKILRRLEQQFKEGIISEEEFEIAEGRADLANIDLAIANAALQTTTSGSNQFEQQLAQARIAAIHDEMSILRDRLDQYYIKAPMSGKFLRSFNADTLLHLVDDSQFIVFLPIAVEDISDLGENTKVTIRFSNSITTSEGQLVAFDDRVQWISGRQIRFAIVQVEASDAPHHHGQFVQCDVEAGEHSIWHYIRKQL